VEYLTVSVVAFAATMAVTAILHRAAPAIGFVDYPGGRKSHQDATPVVGGLAILLGVATVLAIGAFFNSTISGAVAGLYDLKGFLIAAAILTIVGAIDDRWGIRASIKLAIQLACCTMAVIVDGTVVGPIGVHLGGVEIAIAGELVAPFTILVIVTIVNAINLVDGIDGLAGGLTFVACLVMAKAVMTAEFASDGVLLAAILGGLAAFLAVNFPFRKRSRAWVFLGDAGSLLIGFTLAYLAVQLSNLPGRVFRPSTALWFFFIPVTDIVWLYLRRLWFGRAPFAPGRDHIHHLLMRRFSARTTTWILVGFTAATAIAAYAAERLGVHKGIILGAWVAAFLSYGPITHRGWKAAWLRSRRAERKLRPAAEPVAEGAMPKVLGAARRPSGAASE